MGIGMHYFFDMVMAVFYQPAVCEPLRLLRIFRVCMYLIFVRLHLSHAQ